ncbi:MAG: hypothetical protein GKR93_06010 [Gammaproteobacteria bacterium]|nr:hypothetical protein [Gammaproteobacteria bacterium]
MASYTKEDYITLIEKNYFASVSSANIEKILECFSDDCLVTIRHGDNPLRLFRKNPENDEKPLVDFYQHLCGNFDAWFGDFGHYIDAENAKCASTFTVKLNPKSDSSYYPEGLQTLHNCNFFQYSDARITEMTIYYSNVEAGQKSSQALKGATGYPKP